VNDEEYYKRLPIRERANRERMAKLLRDLPRRKAIIARVKAGEITLADGQKMIRNGEQAKGGGE